MITQPLFRRYFFMFAGVATLFIFIAFVASFLIMSFGREKMMMGRGPHQMTIALLKAAGGDPAATIRKMREENSEITDLSLDIIGTDGKSLVSDDLIVEGGLTSEQLAELEANPNIMVTRGFMGPPDLMISKFDDGRFLTVKLRMGGGPPPPPPGERPGFGGGFPPPPGEMPPPGGARPEMFPGGRPPTDRLLMKTVLPGPPNIPFWQNPFWITVGSLMVCVLASIGISLMLFFSNYKRKAETALEVLQDLKSGNLSARMPQGKLDEVAPLVVAFNHMADEVQRLVENLKRSDQSRRQMLQDLAHDLRTPLASLKTFLETMVSDGERLPPERRKDIMKLCLSEVDYFSALVEDLLFLAQLSEPKYAKSVDKVALKDELESQIHIFRERHPEIEVNLEMNDPALALMGSQRLLTRLFRNALSNASSFARGRVNIEVIDDGAFVRLVFKDDGPGFSEKSLQEFGHKKASREISQDQKRISVGIGSLIMAEVAMLHGGSISAENHLENGQVAGAKVTLRLAKA
ncbi:MAG: hypothetical protein KF681_03515 [Bdellovibrionaceae bacterium]|nr:hypothetical protein [Pseudobdellovibrionaceae bacterium]